MLILNFLKELASLYGDLNPTVSLCYHLSDHDLYAGNLFEKTNIFLERITFSQAPATNQEKKDAFKELIIDFEQKKLKCVHIDGMYFMPGSCDQAIIFGKDLETTLKDTWLIKKADYEIVEF